MVSVSKHLHHCPQSKVKLWKRQWRRTLPYLEVTFGKTRNASLRGAVSFSLIRVITHLRPTPSPAQGPFLPCWRILLLQSIYVSHKSVYQTFYNRYLQLFMATLRYTSALPCPLNFRKQLLFTPGTDLPKTSLEIFCWGTV